MWVWVGLGACVEFTLYFERANNVGCFLCAKHRLSLVAAACHARFFFFFRISVVSNLGHRQGRRFTVRKRRPHPPSGHNFVVPDRQHAAELLGRRRQPSGVSPHRREEPSAHAPGVYIGGAHGLGVAAASAQLEQRRGAPSGGWVIDLNKTETGD